MLESRFVDGSKFLWTRVENLLTEIRRYKQEKFIRDKLIERRGYHTKYPLTMEPNLKDGVGGFRDANMVYWIGKLLHNVPRIRELDSSIVTAEDYKEFRIALEFIYKVRTALHIVGKRRWILYGLELLPDWFGTLGSKALEEEELENCPRVEGLAKQGVIGLF